MSTPIMTLKTAYATIKGFEAMRALRKGQTGIFALQGGIAGEARIVEHSTKAATIDRALRRLGKRVTVGEAA